MAIRVETVTLTEQDVEFVLAGGRLAARTEEGSTVTFYRPDAARPEGVPAVPMSEFLVRELRTGGRSGYTHVEHPFVLDVRLVG